MRIYDFLLVINSNFAVSPTVFEMLAFKARKMTCFPHLSLIDAPNRGNPLEFVDLLTPLKLEG